MPTWDALTFVLAFKAAFWLNSTTMHTIYYKELTEDEECRKIIISKEQYQRLITFISDKFEKDANSDSINIKTDAAYGISDAFYEAKQKTQVHDLVPTQIKSQHQRRQLYKQPIQELTPINILQLCFVYFFYI